MKKKRKTKRADLERQRSLLLKIGLIVTLALVFLAFEWKQPHRTHFIEEEWKNNPMEEDIILPTERNEPPPPPEDQPESQTLEIVDDNVEVDFIQINVELNNRHKNPTNFEPVVIKDDAVDDPPFFIVVEEDPRFPNGDAARTQYLKNNVKYPAMARERGVEGIVYVGFIVEPDGSVTNVRVLRGIGGGCDEEALRVVRNMPKWEPGKQRGRPVRVQLTLPIQFTLN